MTKHQDFEQTLDQALQKNIYVVLNAKKKNTVLKCANMTMGVGGRN